MKMEILLLNSRSCVDICGRRRFRAGRSWLYRVSTRVPAQPAPESPQSKVVSLAVCGGFLKKLNNQNKNRRVVKVNRVNGWPVSQCIELEEVWSIQVMQLITILS